MKKKLPDKSRLREEFNKDYESRKQITRLMEDMLEKCLEGLPSNYTVKARVKSFDSYFKKYIRYLKDRKKARGEQSDDGGGLPLIHDTIGIRIVCPFIDDIQAAKQVITEHFTVAQVERKGNESFKEFGYNSLHLLVRIPAEAGSMYRKAGGGDFTGEIAEIQVRTILQDAWAEVEHELVYKAEWTPYDLPMKRKLAAVNASLTLADAIFEEIRHYQQQLQRQLGQRRREFFNQIEMRMDAALFNEAHPEKMAAPAESRPFQGDSSSIDDLLLNALYAHNRGLFAEAIGFYSIIMGMNPADKIAAVILKHRGMAYFAQGRYKEAIDDFEQSLLLDPSSYKSAYYCGIVRSCLKEWQAAAEDFGKSLAIYPYQVFCLYRRAQVYYHIEDYPAALADCEAALNLDYEFEQARRFKTLLLEKLRM
ncbi:MAG: tetratricopeptide repeat protein [Spirochaetaceae bacterium]|jgi:putative GTP pyrophosphokinase|nr:tetratricopeptide repeat protein [Spirochaetaceae bacterium]